MKKFFVILSVFFLAVSSISAEETKSEKTITITMEDESFNPKLFWLNPMGKPKLLGVGAGEYTIPAKATGISVTKTGEKLDMSEILNGAEYQVIKGNPGLNSLGVTMTYAGAVVAGLGLGFGMIGFMEEDKSLAIPALSGAAAGFAIMGGGFYLNKKNRPTFRKL